MHRHNPNYPEFHLLFVGHKHFTIFGVLPQMSATLHTFASILFLASMPIQMSALTLEQLNSFSADEFSKALEPIFENTTWVAPLVEGQRPFESVGQLQKALIKAVKDSPTEKQLVLIRAYPDLAGKAFKIGQIGELSVKEHNSAGLDRLDGRQFAEFQSLNTAYKNRFHFPFILATRDQKNGVQGIVAQFRRRLANSEEQEREEALRQIERIAHFRLEDLLAEGPPRDEATLVHS